MTVSFTQAVRDGTKMLIGVAGPSSSGKTYTALELATGICEIEGGEIFFIDTESNRAKQYADDFTFKHANLDAPFSSERYLEHIEDAHKAGARVIIIDSMSHEHEGAGGILEQHEQELNRMAGNDWKKRERVKFTAWINPKRSHKKFMNRILQIPCHMIFCFRAKDKMMMVKNDKGKNEPVSIGWTPIVADRFEYEMTAILVLPPKSEGRPDLNAAASKIPSFFTQHFQHNQQINRDTGRKLATWAIGQQKPAHNASLSDEQAQGRGDAALAPLPILTSLHDTLCDASNDDMVKVASNNMRDQITGLDADAVQAARDIIALHYSRVRNEMEVADAITQCKAILEKFDG